MSLIGRVLKAGYPHHECRDHIRAAKHVCLTCEMLMCSACVRVAMATGTHSGHKVLELDEAFEQFKSQLHQNSGVVTRKSTEAKQSFKTNTSDFHKSVMLLKKQIEQKVQDVVKTATDWEKDINKDIDKVIRSLQEDVEDYDKREHAFQNAVSRHSKELDEKSVDALFDLQQQECLKNKVTSLCDDCNVLSEIKAPNVSLYGRTCLDLEHLVVKVRQIYMIFYHSVICIVDVELKSCVLIGRVSSLVFKQCSTSHGVALFE